MLIHGEVKGIKGNTICLELQDKVMDKVLRYREGNSSLVEVRLNDGRTVTNEQRKKYYATLKDISDYSGELVEYLHDYFKAIYCYRNKIEHISMSNCSVTEARELINIVMDFILMNDIPLNDLGLNRTDDIDRYLYMCLINRKCAVCGKSADIHHCTGSRVGMGMDRNSIDNVGRQAIALCREHHSQAHMSEEGFFSKWKIYGIKLDKYAVEKLKL